MKTAAMQLLKSLIPIYCVILSVGSIFKYTEQYVLYPVLNSKAVQRYEELNILGGTEADSKEMWLRIVGYTRIDY